MPRDLSFVTLAATLFAAAAATAQPVQSFSDVGQQLNVGDRVRVVDSDGRRHEGSVRSLSPSTLVVDGPAGTRGFTAATTARIARRGDGLGNGLLIGAVTGGVLGVVIVADFDDNQPAGNYLAGGSVLGLTFAGIGALVDALHEGERTVYAAAGVRATVAPLVSPRAVGVAAALRW